MKDPAVLFYTSDFLTGTMFMTNEQVGIYIRLLCSQHQHGGFIDKVSFNSLTEGHAAIKIKFIETDDGFYNERLMSEMDSRCKKSTNMSNAAKDTWKKRKENTIVKQKQKKSKTKAIQPEDVNEDEVVNYFTENGYTIIAAKKFFKYYSEAAWRDGKGNPVLNWKQKAQAVWFKDENKIQSSEKKMVY